MNETLRNSEKNRRSGGRSARKALRSAPLAKDLRPVMPGLIGGSFNPLSDEQVGRIHESALRVLEEIGMADAPESGIRAMTGAGAILGDDGRIRFPNWLVDKMVSEACRDFSLYGRTPDYDLLLKKNRGLF